MTTPTGGPWTRHGHTIPGITIDGPGRPRVARCGGPRLCFDCAADASKAEERKSTAETPQPAPQPEPPADAPAALATDAPTCDGCGRSRTSADELDYNPLQVITGRPLGWYSGDDGEICGACMTDTIRRQ